MNTLLPLRGGVHCSPPDPSCPSGGTQPAGPAWNDSAESAFRHVELTPTATSAVPVPRAHHPYPTVDVPDHAHYTIGSVILAVGITGMVGNFLVMYAFCRSRSLRTPANMFIINLAVADFLMCVTQTPIFFIASMHKRWIFGEKVCELYAFCGALFGICSMITLTVIAVDRYVVITRPLASIGLLSHRRALLILAATWGYSLSWSLPPFFGWSAYVPEGLLTSCTWDYMTFTPSVRAYTMLLFIFVFFIPLFIIMYCYAFIFRSIRETNKAVNEINKESKKDSMKKFQRMKSDWKMAKIALILILLYVVSWSPYSCVALTAFAGYADMLTPYMNSVPAVIAKASAIHNPIIYAITHPKYRSALARYIPCLGVLLCVPAQDRFVTSSFMSARRSTLISQSSVLNNPLHRSIKSHLSSALDNESAPADTDAKRDLSSPGSGPASRQVSSQIAMDSAELLPIYYSSSIKNHDSTVFEKAGVVQEGAGFKAAVDRIPSIFVTSESSHALPGSGGPAISKSSPHLDPVPPSQPKNSI
ncbi:melanopsin-A-like [Brienomyrus brachyistius]|uniref:melanopsin-A-like n=1 Tax=Brienomyrus brachyistius TaxID=42636 RepID=UPI0020B36A89|nr:melanopsin-A-like [Brienomyrus brachyistius]